MRHPTVPCAPNFQHRALLPFFLLLTLFLAPDPAICQNQGEAPPPEDQPWRSGELVSRETYLYGAFEARLKASAGSGAITGFLLISPESMQGVWQELAFEFFGKSFGDTYQTQIIIPGPPEDDPIGSPRTQNIEEMSSSVDFTEEWVTVRLEWKPDEVAFVYNGNRVRTETDPDEYAKFFDRDQVRGRHYFACMKNLAFIIFYILSFL
jgi:beta-glucanase (GH16 family)